MKPTVLSCRCYAGAGEASILQVSSDSHLSTRLWVLDDMQQGTLHKVLGAGQKKKICRERHDGSCTTVTYLGAA